MSTILGGSPQRTWVLSAAILLYACSMLGSVLGSAPAGAAEVKPLGIAKFTMNTTGPTKIASLGSGRYEFVNEPYAFTQAGGHPWALTTTIEFASEEVENKEKIHLIVPTRDPKDIVVDLPPGLLGNPMAVPRCPLVSLAGRIRCPSSTQIGVYRIRWFGGKEELAPIVNVTPENGQSAEFALENDIKIEPILTGHLVRTPEGYGFAVLSNEIPLVEVVSVETTFWGVPADPSHDAMRGLLCASVARGLPLSCASGVSGGQPAGVPIVPFLTMPTNCAAGSENATVRADSWREPGRVYENQQYVGYVEGTVGMPAVTGCNLLAFNPLIEVQPDSSLADEPVGLGVNVRVPLNERPESNATPQVRDSSVTFPEGLSVSPGVVDGIRACDEFGPEGIDITGPESEDVGLNGELQLAPGHCPDASIVGTAEALTPLLPTPVRGHVYLARPGCGASGQKECTEEDARDGNLYRLYLELGGTGELANTGVHFKVALETEANPATGQLSSRVKDTPQAPFSELKIRLNGGPRAPLANPAACGPAATTADFTPWSGPGETPQHTFVVGTPDATPSSFFEVGGCVGGTPMFNPGFTAGVVTPQAAKFSPFTLNLSRQDREQYVKGIQVHTPPGLLGVLASVPLCGEPAANEGKCPGASRIGTTKVASGAGSHPFEISGNVYLTGPYEGAPFGLSVVTNATAGPFNLGLVVVRARIDVDSATSTLTVTTDESGPHAIPQIIFGVPLRLQRVTVNIARPDFMFNPTNCKAQQISANISGNQQTVAKVSSPFAVGGCKSLVFKPKFTVSTNGRTSRLNGASLDTKLSYPAGSLGIAANIARVKVSLPKQLPSRLTTLQKACPAATFNQNPALCPNGIVGTVRASTPLLPVGLAGPVYFVSHGGEAFPTLVVVLQGDGVRVDLTGTTFINKAGITSSTFKTVPDVPVNKFELYLPQGKGSALAANGNLCKTAPNKLVMPTEFVAQNGAILKQITKIQVTGCAARHGKSASHNNTHEPARASRRYRSATKRGAGR
jgi:hypothetical protein